MIGRRNGEQERRKLREKREIGGEKAKGHRHCSSPSSPPLLLLVVQSSPLDLTVLALVTRSHRPPPRRCI
ncbi:uncharacterized protein DS421_19g660590 [Arachis hypogaea]|uniref:Uncharacterized protein n=1 Tax=Arachis hypogaea TaxID=3818 RepID=A0A6B9VCC3_ARAHY|nr:uncharacterized protein DS421_19g660590 [Arachis hypogaea]